MAPNKTRAPKARNSECVPSVMSERLFTPNPMYLKFDALVDCDVRHIYDMIDLENCDVDDLLANPEINAMLDGIIDRFEDTPLVKPTMPPCPQAQQLYARIPVDQRVTDLGSGDGKKASKCQAKITMLDKEPGSVFVKYADINDMDFVDQDVVYTSFNVLSQLEEATVKRLEDSEGLHVAVDLKHVIVEMGSEQIAENVYRTMHNGVEYIDTDHKLEGDEIATGYIGYNTYEDQKYVATCARKKTQTAEFAVPVEDTTQQMPGDSTPKYDGIAMRFRGSKKGFACLSKRNGDGLVYDWTGPDIDLLLEKLPVDGPAQHYALLRVSFYKGRIPFHGVQGLKKFCSRVKIKIDGVSVVSPGSEELRHYPSDGLIYRVEGTDFRLKRIPTIDVYFGTLMNLMDSLCYNYEVYGRFDRGKLGEFAITRKTSGGFNIRFVRYRDDKTTPTNEGAIVYYMNAAPMEIDDSKQTTG